jgi:putative tryptophan/tyrosine transport system substrate-binding protein
MAFPMRRRAFIAGLGGAALWPVVTLGQHPKALPRLALHPQQVREPKDFEAAFVAIAQERPDGLLVLVDALLNQYKTQIVDFTIRKQLPAVFPFREFTELGGLMSYGPNLRDMFRIGAGYVDKILKGAKPADLPIEQPTKFELVINLKTAKALGLDVPHSLLARADEVIE